MALKKTDTYTQNLFIFVTYSLGHHKNKFEKRTR